MKTRGKGSTKDAAATKTAAEANEASKSTTPKVLLGPESVNPPQTFILPTNLHPEARIVTLQNPKTLSDSRYIICPERGIYEFTKIATPKTTPRSWLLSSALRDGESLGNITDTRRENTEGYIMKDANLFIATPLDPLFVVLPALCPMPGPKALDKKLFLSVEDYLDRIAANSPHMRTFLRTKMVRSQFEGRMAVVSDTVDAGDETMYRLNEGKLLEELLRKSKKVVLNGLPSSMEEKLVRKALEQPALISMPQDDSTIEEEDTIPASCSDTPDTQSTIASVDTSFSETSSATTSFSESKSNVSTLKPSSQPPIAAPNGVAELLRLRMAFLYICSAYITPHITENLKKLLATSSSTDFSPLDKHLTHLAKLRQETLAARSTGDFSRKRGLDEDEDEEKRSEKRWKEEEEKKKKANESRGVKALKKVNVSGMKKMSDFFKKK
jgi:hypothetical protein